MPTLGARGPQGQRHHTWYKGAVAINAEAVGVLDTQEDDVTPLGVQVAFLKKQHLRGDPRVTSPHWRGRPSFPGL